MAKAKQRAATNPWGVPDPRDADAYPKPTVATPMAQWAWEFLRRRSDYRDRWEREVRPFLLQDGSDWNNQLIDQHHEEVLREAVQHRRAVDWSPPWGTLHAKFRVSSSPANGALDPRLSWPPTFDGQAVILVGQGATFVGRGATLPLVLHDEPQDSLKVGIQFDLSLPIDAQWKAARAVLLRRQKRLAAPTASLKFQVELFPLYLRLLDFEPGTSDKEIGWYLAPHKSGGLLRDYLNKAALAASRWQQDYLLIALHPPASS
jgi:hypothetical protein